MKEVVFLDRAELSFRAASDVNVALILRDSSESLYSVFFLGHRSSDPHSHRSSESTHFPRLVWDFKVRNRKRGLPAFLHGEVVLQFD